MTTTISDETVLSALRERERERERAAREAAEALDPRGPCPVCGGKLQAGPEHPALAPIRRLPAVKCTGAGCDFAAPLRPNIVGAVLGVAIGVAMGLVGLTIVLDAQQLTDGQQRLVRFATGAIILSAGFWLASRTQAVTSTKLLGQRIAAARRQREEGRKGPPPSWAGENLRELVFAAVLYLILRHFVVEAFVIPTGSMAPTLYGNNYRVDCARCQYPFAVGRADGELAVGTGTAVCPVCRHRFQFDKADHPSDGNKILVNKLLYRLGPPERYDVVVFRNPERPWESYIKRIVGLPGETIQVKNGDLYVDGKLAPKPPHVQDAVWIPVYDGRYPAPGLAACWAPPDGAPAPAGAVAMNDDGSRFTLTPQGGTVWLEYDSPDEERGVMDATSYNSSRNDGHRGHHAVGDLRVTARVTAAAGARVHLATVEDGRLVTATFPVGQGAYTLEAGGQVLGTSEARAALAPGEAVEVAIAYADDRVRLIVDGETLLDVADPGAPTSRVYLATARIGATDGEATFEAVRIDRDIYYRKYPFPAFTSTDPAEQPVTIPAGRYFAMGDNSPSSKDSRDWGFVHEGHIQGRAFLVWWPLVWPFDGRLVR